uniref:RRM domain-containing protein n=1 Tax=Tetraodon nigroviridis TaxID=99883 RepID=H3C5Y4_TETNG
MAESHNQMLNPGRVRKFENWLKRTNTKLTQVYGQRKYGGPPEGWDGPTPGARCEIYITHIPRDTYEDVLIPLFSTVGSLWEFRLMMNFSGQNRGFAYAKYGSEVIAANAVRLLHGHVMDGVSLCVQPSTEKRQLCIGGLPTTTRHADLLQVELGNNCGVSGVNFKNVVKRSQQYGFCEKLPFSSHHAATHAKKVVMEEFQKQYAMRVTIKWLPAVKPRSHNLLPPQNLVNVFCGSSELSNSPGFRRAVGGPTAAQHGCSTTSSLMSATCPMMLLSYMCQINGFGQPHCEISCHHAEPDGYLHFSYKVFNLGRNILEGVIMILPGVSVASTVEEARRAVAQQVLRRLFPN